MNYKKTKKKTVFIISAVICLLAIISVTVYFISFHKKDTEKKFDQNNVGEIYCAPIDEKHVATDKRGVMFADNEILIVAKDGTEKNDMEKLAQEYNAEIVGFIEQTGDYQLKFSDTYSLDELEKTADKLKNEKIVSSADVNYICKMSDDSVEDIKLGDKWENDLFKGTNFFTGKTKFSSNDKMWGAKAINAPTAWHAMDLLKNNIEPVKVGLIDGGFDKDHEDLEFAEIFYDNGVNGVESKDIVDKDYKYHGTHVAGTMAARGDNKEGICGIYPYGNGNLYGVTSNGEFKYSENGTYNSSSMYQKIAFAELILRNVKVINSSQNNRRDRVNQIVDKTNDWESALNELNKNAEILGDFLNRLLRKKYDFIIISAAGNSSSAQTGNLESTYNSFINSISEKKYSEVYKRIIVVGSVGQSYNISKFSNAGNRVDIFAPGENIYSTIAGNKYGIKYTNSESKNVTFSGTSMASPHVAGVCADVWSMNKYLTGAEVKDIVCRSTIDNVVVYTTPNKETRGVVDANKAVAEAYNRLATSGKVKEEPKNSAILGWVVDKSDEDTKIKNASVSAQLKNSSNKPVETTTDEYGHFELIAQKGEYTITVKASKEDGYNDYVFDYNVEENGNVYYPDWVKMEKQKYTWVVQPAIDAEDIIVMDESNVPNNSRSVFKVPNYRNEKATADRKNYAIIKKDGKYGFIGYDGKNLYEINYDGFAGCCCGVLGLKKGEEYDFTYLSKDLKLLNDYQESGHGTPIHYTYYSEQTGFFKTLLPSDALPEKYTDYNSNQYDLTGTNLVRKIKVKNYKKSKKEWSCTIVGLGNYAIVKNGKPVTDYIFTDVEPLLDLKKDRNIIACKKNGKWGYFNSNGKEIIPCEFNDAVNLIENFEKYTKQQNVYLPTEGYIAVCNDKGFGYYDINGKEVISCGEFEQARPVFGGKAWVKKNGKWGVIQITEKESKNDKNTNKNSDNVQTKNNHEAVLKKTVKTSLASGMKIAEWFYDDFDKDGKKEAFAVIGKRYEMSDSNYIGGDFTALYHIDYNHRITEFKINNWASYENPKVAEYQGQKFFYLVFHNGGSGMATYIFSVRKAHPYQLSISGQICTFDPQKLTGTISKFKEGGGHIWPEVKLRYNKKEGQFYKVN